MRCIDVFNGDADGLCALHQLRLAQPLAAELVTGVKRDTGLLARVRARRGDVVTVLDISLDANRADLLRLLRRGALVRYFDHHYAGDIPAHGNLDAHIDTAPDTCTSAIVDRHLGGRWRPWAVAAAYGDNLPALAERLADQARLDAAARTLLAKLGVCLNYNAYGDSVAELQFDPAALLRAMQPFADPLRFVQASDAFARLDAGYAQDMERASRVQPQIEGPAVALFILPDANWARRAGAAYANRLASEFPGRAHAVLSRNARGGYTVSVRAPQARPSGAERLCMQFASGGGRAAAAGINHLPAADLERFAQKLQESFAGP